MSHVQGDAAARKAQPIVRGCLDYFPDALLAVAELSRIGNEQHNPGEPLHWAKEKSTDEADALLRHLIDRGTVDTDGVRHSTKVAWRALALLQREIDAERSGVATVQLVQAAGDIVRQALSGLPLRHVLGGESCDGPPDCSICGRECSAPQERNPHYDLSAAADLADKVWPAS